MSQPGRSRYRGSRAEQSRGQAEVEARGRSVELSQRQAEVGTGGLKSQGEPGTVRSRSQERKSQAESGTGRSRQPKTGDKQAGENRNKQGTDRHRENCYADNEEPGVKKLAEEYTVGSQTD